ncbi:MAG: four helix bundle protein [Nanoarchaeota archaeon]|nr:four helix bundle protein [Nanoarchaeota archaeon]
MVWIKEKMKVWVRANEFANEVCVRVLKFPNSSWKHSVSDQMTGSAGSIPDNIGEGCLGTNAEFINYLRIARRSGNELQVQVGRACSLGYLSAEEMSRYLKELEEIGKMINGTIRYLKKRV